MFDASDGRSLFTARLAPPGPRTEASKALACAASLLCAPVAALASFANREPWREPQRGRAVFEDQALLGGRRPWLLAANLGLAAWLAWRVRRETRAWGRSPWLGRCWVAATLLLGAVGWASFRLGEPRPARAEPARERSGRAPAAAGSDGVALGAR